MSNREKEFIDRMCRDGGYTEVPQTPDGLFCTKCMCVHKRPTKMYTTGKTVLGNLTETVCRYFLLTRKEY